MHLKTLLVGILLGAALGVAGVYFFDDDFRDQVASGTRGLGQGVKRAGEVIEDQGNKLR